MVFTEFVYRSWVVGASRGLPKKLVPKLISHWTHDQRLGPTTDRQTLFHSGPIINLKRTPHPITADNKLRPRTALFLIISS